MSTDISGQKTKAKRLEEAVYLLRKLDEVGAGPDNGGQGYLDTKARLSDWVKEGYSWAGKIRFPSVGRVADIVLPMKSTVSASINFRAV